jgi:hypothetical protein
MVSAHRLFAPARPLQHAAVDPALELDEADIIWGAPGGSLASSPVDTYGRSALSASSPASRASRPRAAAPRESTGGGGGPASMPVNIPDWSKILGPEYGGGSAGAGRWPSDDRGDAYLERGGGEGGWVPPHEQLMCRERAAASFSVREGAGRTLKGRDLRRVRNAIWEKTGFQD